MAESRITSQNQISVPADVRKKLGVGPGSVLEWVEEGGKMVVRRKAKLTFADIHRELFPNGPPRRRSVEQMKEGIAEYMRKKHGRR